MASLEEIKAKLQTLKGDAEQLAGAADEGDEKSLAGLTAKTLSAIEEICGYLEGIEERLSTR